MTTENTTTSTEAVATDSWEDTKAVSNKPNTSWDDEPAKAETKAEPKAEEPLTKKEKRWLTAKVNGKEEKVDEETLLRDYQKYKAADQKFNEAAHAKKSVEAFMHQLQNDPEAVLNNPNLPIDRKKLAEKWLMQQIEQELNPTDPRDLKYKQLEEELNGYKSKEEQAKQEQEQYEYQQVVASKKEELGNMFAKAMEASPLSKNPETAAATLREMALYYRACKQQGETPSPEEIAQHVEQKHYKAMYSLADTLDGEELVNFLGESLVKKIRKYDLGRLTKGKESPKSNQQGDWDSKQEAPNKKESPQDAKDRIRKQLLGR